MTDTEPTPDPAAWDEKNRAHERRASEFLPANKTALFDVLAAAGITIVTVTFDGYGDSGQIENIEAKAGKEEVIALPQTQIELAFPVWESLDVERRVQSVSEAIETLAYAFLNRSHQGWENDDGAYDEFTFDVAAQTITLDYNERYTSSENYTHEF